MALTYTEIEEQKNTRILLFFLIVVAFYFLTAIVLTAIAKVFLVSYLDSLKSVDLSVSAREILIALLVALAAAGIHILHSVRNAMKYVEDNLSTEVIDYKDRYHKRLASIVEEVNVATGGKYRVRPVVIPTVAMNAFSMADRDNYAIVGVTEGLLSKLSRQQLQAVVAHEMAHVASGDSLQTTIGCALFGVYAAMAKAALTGLKGSRHVRRPGKGGGAVILFMLLMYLTLRVTQFFYGLIRFALSRERELRADAVAVRLTRDPIGLAEALHKISSGWRGIGYIERELASLFIINPAVDARDEREGWWSNLLSTHPPIRRRIDILAGMAHVSAKEIENNVRTEMELRDRSREMPRAPEEALWMFSGEDGSWQGPFSLSQAMVLGWLKPDTWIKRLESEGLLQAKDEPLLDPVFDSKLKASRLSDLDCPKCKKRLVEEEYEGVMVRRCVFCQGALVRWKKLPRIGMRTEKGFDERIKKLALHAERDGLRGDRDRRVSPLACPKCGGKMYRGRYSVTYPVEVDKCLMCSLIWFDRDEIEMFQYLLETKGVIPDGWD
jgi:heat shock protein HtpX